MSNSTALPGAIIRIVLDANVLFSGCAFKSGNPRKILDLVAKHKVALVINKYIVEEVNVDYLISSDKDINSHNETTSNIDKLITVMTPRQFIDIIFKESME